MRYKIVTDSSANVQSLDGVDFASVPLHILVGDKDYVDDKNVDLDAMQADLTAYKGKTSTSCPSAEEWRSAFGDAEVIFCTTITSKLSGSNVTANVAKQMYENEHPDRTVYVIDSLTTGPEMALLIEKLRDLILSGMDHSEIYRKIGLYMKKTHIFFELASVYNLAKNGRINPLLAKGLGILGIRIVATGSEEGTIQTLEKCRGEKRALRCIVQHMKSCGYSTGKIVIAHFNNEAGALDLKERIIEEFGSFNGYIHRTGALCAYYAEPESVLIGFEA